MKPREILECLINNKLHDFTLTFRDGIIFLNLLMNSEEIECIDDVIMVTINEPKGFINFKKII